jgi:hypothetical protein
VPSDNAYVDNLLPTKSFGGSGVLIVQNTPSIPVSLNYAFLKFDLANNLPAYLVQSISKPSNASLQLFVRLMNFYYNATVEVHTASPNNWTENEITWNSMPQIEPNYASLNIQQNGTWARWNLTRLINPAFNAADQITLAVISSETLWKNLIWFDSNENPFTNGTTTPTLNLTFEEPLLTIETPYPNIPISIGNEIVDTNTNGTARTLLPWGNYSVSVPDAIPLGSGTRAAFDGWSDGITSANRRVVVGNSLVLTANYVTQYLLEASSPYGNVTGGGWYFENAIANLSVEPSSVPVEGVPGWLGGRYVFDHWSGDCSSSTAQCSIMMNGPKQAIAVWRVDWSETAVASIVLVASALLLAMRARLRKGTKAHRRNVGNRKSPPKSHRQRRS